MQVGQAVLVGQADLQLVQQEELEQQVELQLAQGYPVSDGKYKWSLL